MVLDAVARGYPGSGGSYYGKGKLFLSPSRITFVVDSRNVTFDSFEMPLAQLNSARLKKKFFGSSTIRGSMNPTVDGNLIGKGKYKFTFKDGSAEEFYLGLREALLHLSETGFRATVSN
eukprot:gene16540-19644_t